MVTGSKILACQSNYERILIVDDQSRAHVRKGRGREENNPDHG